MDLDDLKKMMLKDFKTKTEAGKEIKPRKENLSFFPGNLRGKVLKMTSADLTTEALPTIVIGTISASYDEDMWDKDLNRRSSVLSPQM